MADALVTGEEQTADQTGGEETPAPQGQTLADIITDEELKNDPTVQKFKSPDDLAKSYKELEKFKGKAVQIPDENASPEEKAKFFEKLGRPDSADKYEIPDVSDVVPEGFELKQNDDFLNTMKKTAHEIGLTNNQFQTLAKQYFQGLAQEAQDKFKDVQAFETLKNFYGDENKVDENIKLAQNVIENIAGDQIKDTVFNQVQDNPTMIKFLADIGSRLGEDTMTEQPSGGAPDRQTQIQERISEIRANPEFTRSTADPEFNPTEHKKLNDELAKLYDEQNRIQMKKEYDQMQQQIGSV